MFWNQIKSRNCCKQVESGNGRVRLEGFKSIVGLAVERKMRQPND